MKCESCGEDFDSLDDNGYCENCADELAPPKEGVMCDNHDDVQATHYLGGHPLCDDCFENDLGDPS